MNTTDLSLSYRKYLKLKRLLSPHLIIAENDPELFLGKEYDDTTDITQETDTSNIGHELNAVNYYLTYSISLGYGQPPNFDLYKTLMILFKAQVVLKGNHRLPVYARIATIYQLLNNKVLAIHSARQCVACVLSLDQERSSYPPLAVNFIRAVSILVEWDDSDEAAFYIQGGLRILRKIATLWTAADLLLKNLINQLKVSIHERERRITECLYDSRRHLEREIFHCLNQQLKPELTAAAVQFARDAHSFEQIQHKRQSVQ
jgi:hypothetical protein